MADEFFARKLKPISEMVGLCGDPKCPWLGKHWHVSYAPKKEPIRPLPASGEGAP